MLKDSNNKYTIEQGNLLFSKKIKIDNNEKVGVKVIFHQNKAFRLKKNITVLPYI